MSGRQQPGHKGVTDERRPFLSAEWRDLVLLNHQVDPAILLPLVPRETELDTWNGQAFVSLVGFRFLKTRILGFPVPFHVNFDEINLRFYVRRQVGGETRQGVVFIREVVARAAIAILARLTYNEPYVTMPTRHYLDMEQAENGGSGVVRYEWRQDRWYTLEARVQGPATDFDAGSEAEFFTHRMWGYTTQRDGAIMEYRVVHPRWRTWRAVSHRLDCDTEAMFGQRLGAALKSPAASVLVAAGSPVKVFPGQPLR